MCLTGLEPDKGFRCSIPMCDQNLSNASVDDFGLDIFKHENGDIDYCLQYPYKNVTHQSQCSEDDFDHKSNTFVKCDPHMDNITVIYESFAMDTSIATEFDLLCDDQYKVTALDFSLLCIYCNLNTQF